MFNHKYTHHIKISEQKKIFRSCRTQFEYSRFKTNDFIKHIHKYKHARANTINERERKKSQIIAAEKLHLALKVICMQNLETHTQIHTRTHVVSHKWWYNALYKMHCTLTLSTVECIV